MSNKLNSYMASVGAALILHLKRKKIQKFYNGWGEEHPMTYRSSKWFNVRVSRRAFKDFDRGLV